LHENIQKKLRTTHNLF